jgi:hypothetical protein
MESGVDNLKGERYLLVKGKAGLGNRMLVVLDSILYAEMTGRKLLVDWRDGKYGALGENAFPQLFETPAAGDLSVIASCKTVTPSTWHGHLDESVDSLFAREFPNNSEMDTVPRVAARYTVNVAVPDAGDDIAVRWGWTHELDAFRSRFTGRLAFMKSWTEEEVLRHVIRERVTPVKDLRDQIDRFRRENFAEKTIGVHVRFSDRKDAYDSSYKYVNRFLARYPNGAIFLATDNIAVEKDFKSRYKRVIVTTKWLPPAGVAIHRNDLPERRPLENAREALLDLYLLGECDALVCNTLSTFSILAKLLSRATGDDLIDNRPVSIKPLIRRSLRRLKLMRCAVGVRLGFIRLFTCSPLASETLAPEVLCLL